MGTALANAAASATVNTSRLRPPNPRASSARFRRLLGCLPLSSFSTASATAAAHATNSRRATAASALAAAGAAVCGYYFYSRLLLAPRLPDPLFRPPALVNASPRSPIVGGKGLGPTKNSAGHPAADSVENADTSGFVREILSRDQRFFAGLPAAPRPILDCHVATVASNNPSEDRYSVSRLADDRLLFGVYDGHAGQQCSQTLATKFPTYIARHLAANPANPSAALADAYTDFDADLLQLSKKAMEYESSAPNPNRTKMQDMLMPAIAGSVLLTVLAQPDKLYVAHAGDCRAVLGRRNPTSGRWISVPLTLDHDVSNPSEVKRMIDEHPGEEDQVVRHGRVLGHLQPFRAMGDARYKWSIPMQEWVNKLFSTSDYPYRFAMPNLRTPPYVTARPDVSEFPIGPEDQFVVLATDGLWERLSEEHVVMAVAKYLDPSSQPVDLEISRVDANAATHVIRNALGGQRTDEVASLLRIPPPDSRSYRDDITVLVVFLKPNLEGPSGAIKEAVQLVSPTEERIAHLGDNNKE